MADFLQDWIAGCGAVCDTVLEMLWNCALWLMLKGEGLEGQNISLGKDRRSSIFPFHPVSIR